MLNALTFHTLIETKASQTLVAIMSGPTKHGWLFCNIIWAWNSSSVLNEHYISFLWHHETSLLLMSSWLIFISFHFYIHRSHRGLAAETEDRLWPSRRETFYWSLCFRVLQNSKFAGIVYEMVYTTQFWSRKYICSTKLIGFIFLNSDKPDIL